MPDKVVRGFWPKRWKQDGNKISARRFYAYYLHQTKHSNELKGVLSPYNMLSRVKEAAQKVNILGKGSLFFFQVASIIKIQCNHVTQARKTFSDSK